MKNLTMRVMAICCIVVLIMLAICEQFPEWCDTIMGNNTKTIGEISETGFSWNTSTATGLTLPEK